MDVIAFIMVIEFPYHIPKDGFIALIYYFISSGNERYVVLSFAGTMKLKRYCIGGMKNEKQNHSGKYDTTV